MRKHSITSLLQWQGRFLLIGIAVVTSLVVSGLLIAKQAWSTSRAAHWRQVGLAGLDSADPASGLKNLGKYLLEQPDDVDALFSFAKARIKLIAPEKAHLEEALKSLAHCGELAPRRFDIWLEIARLHVALGLDELALGSARHAYSLNPDSQQSIGLLVNVLLEHQLLNDADELLTDGLSTYPASWPLCILRLNWMQRVGCSSEELMAQAKEFIDRDPDDSRMLILPAVAAGLSGNTTSALDALQIAVEKAPVNDADYTRSLLVLADDMRFQDAGLLLLQRSPDAFDDPFLSLWYARRRWEAGQPQDIVQALQHKSLPLVTDPELNLLVAVSLSATRQSTALDALLNRLETQQTTESATRWYRLISSAVQENGHSDQELVEAATLALEVCPDSPIARYIQASAYYGLGEYKIAARLSKATLQNSPNWFLLWQLHSTSLLLSGQVQEARDASRTALKTFPRNVDALLTWASLEAILLPSRNDAYAKGLLD